MAENKAPAAAWSDKPAKSESGRLSLRSRGPKLDPVVPVAADDTVVASDDVATGSESPRPAPPPSKNPILPPLGGPPLIASSSSNDGASSSPVTREQTTPLPGEPELRPPSPATDERSSSKGEVAATQKKEGPGSSFVSIGSPTPGKGGLVSPPTSERTRRPSISESLRPKDLKQEKQVRRASVLDYIRGSVGKQSEKSSDEAIEDNARKSVCGRFCQNCSSLRKKAAPHCRQLNKNRFFQIMMFMALVAALFLPDLWIVANRPNNDDLDGVLTVVLFLFLVELVVQSIGLAKTYLGSFFFIMDIVGAASLLLDLSYLPFKEMMENMGGGGDSDDGGGGMGGNVMVTRLARVAKLGARAGRFTKLVKLLRFLPGMRDQGSDQGTAKVISARLITALATRVSCLIIIMVMVMPLFSMWTYPEQDWSMKTWLTIIDNGYTRNKGPARAAEQLRRFEAFYAERSYWPYRLTHKFTNVVLWESTRDRPARVSNTLRYENGNTTCEFNFTSQQQIDSGMNMLLMFLIMVLMVGFSFVLSHSVSAIVLKPLEELLKKVRKMASTIFQSVTDMGNAIAEDQEDAAEDSFDEDEDLPAANDAFNNETQLLKKVVAKLAVLSEITMNSQGVDAETMEGLGEADLGVIQGYQGKNQQSAAWGDTDEGDEEEEDQEHDNVLRQQRAMVENAGLSLELLDSWDLNPLELDKARIMAAGKFFLGPHNHGVHFDPIVMGVFLEVVEAGYIKTCPYHNWFHAIDVTHGIYRLLQICATEAYLSGHERYALLVAAICHDVGHPGFNNPFLIETYHELALRYNDKSPLENMHCARLFEFVSAPARNVFGTLSKPQFQEVRKICIEAILHTDNACHFAMIKEVQMMYEVNSEILDGSRELYHQARHGEVGDEFPTKEAIECFRTPESKKLLRKLLLHVSDISNSMKPFRICRIWANQVLEEFFAQGDKEKNMGIPVQALNDRDKVNRPMSQIGFIEFLVCPLIFVVTKVVPPTESLAEQLISNVKTWHKHWENETKPPPSESEQKQLADRMAKLELKYKER